MAMTDSEMLLSDDERENDDAIIAAREDLAARIENAAQEVQRAMKALNRLHEQYDVEYAEGRLGDDMQVYLDTARRELANAAARQV